MNDSLFVRTSQGVGRLVRDCDRSIERQLSLTVYAFTKRFAFYVRHDVVEHRLGVSRVDQWDDVRMLKLRQEAYLPQKPQFAVF